MLCVAPFGAPAPHKQFSTSTPAWPPALGCDAATPLNGATRRWQRPSAGGPQVQTNSHRCDRLRLESNQAERQTAFEREFL